MYTLITLNLDVRKFKARRESLRWLHGGLGTMRGKRVVLLFRYHQPYCYQLFIHQLLPRSLCTCINIDKQLIENSLRPCLSTNRAEDWNSLWITNFHFQRTTKWYKLQHLLWIFMLLDNLCLKSCHLNVCCAPPRVRLDTRTTKVVKISNLY